jgi:hypothetical protein
MLNRRLFYYFFALIVFNQAVRTTKMYEHPDLSNDFAKSHLDTLIAEAHNERLGRGVTNETVSDNRNGLLNWLAAWRKPIRQVLPKGI